MTRHGTLGELQQAVDELVQEHGRDRRVGLDADGVELDGVAIEDKDEWTVFY